MVSITPEVGRPQQVRIIYSNGKSVFVAFVDFGSTSISTGGITWHRQEKERPGDLGAFRQEQEL